MYDVMGNWPYIGVLASSRLVLTSYARRVRKINENRLTARRSVGFGSTNTQKINGHRCFSLLMAKYWFTSPIPSHYDTINNTAVSQLQSIILCDSRAFVTWGLTSAMWHNRQQLIFSSHYHKNTQHILYGCYHSCTTQ